MRDSVQGVTTGLAGLSKAMFRASYCLLASVAFTQPYYAAGQSNVTVVATANNAFACDLYGRLRMQDGNLFFSPYSISTCLAMVDAGARGSTAAQMAAVLAFAHKLGADSCRVWRAPEGSERCRQDGRV